MAIEDLTARYEELNAKQRELINEISSLNAEHAKYLLEGNAKAAIAASKLRPKIAEMESEIAALEGAKPAVERLIDQAERREFAIEIRNAGEATAKHLKAYGKTFEAMDHHLSEMANLWRQADAHLASAKKAAKPHFAHAKQYGRDSFFGNWVTNGSKALNAIKESMKALTESGRRFEPISPAIQPHVEQLAERVREDFEDLMTIVDKGGAR